MSDQGERSELSDNESPPEDFELLENDATESAFEDDEDEEVEEGVEVGEVERQLKRALGIGFRVSFASLLLLGLFDFFFSSVWLHGYVWALNQAYTRKDISDKSEGFLQAYQEQLLPRRIKAFLLSLAVSAIYLFIKCVKLEEVKIGELLKLSLIIGAVVGGNRWTQEQHKIFPALHEATFAYLAFFIVSFVILVRKPPPPKTVHLKAE